MNAIAQCPHGCDPECLDCGSREFVWDLTTEPSEDHDNFAALVCADCGAEHYDGLITFEQAAAIKGAS